MARVHLRRGLGALALALGVVVAAAPAARAAEEPLSPEAEEILEGIAENSNELGAALEALPEEEREHVIHELELLAEENGSPYYDTHCIPILLDGGTVDGVVQSNVPEMLAVPPVRREALRACPAVIGLAVGANVIVGVPFAMVKVTIWLSSAVEFATWRLSYSQLLK